MKGCLKMKLRQPYLFELSRYQMAVLYLSSAKEYIPEITPAQSVTPPAMSRYTRSILKERNGYGIRTARAWYPNRTGTVQG